MAFKHLRSWAKFSKVWPCLHFFLEWKKIYQPPLFHSPPQDPKCEIRKVMEFLGTNLKEEVLDKTVYNASFVIVKNNPTTNHRNDAKMNHQLSPFMRKGDVYLPRLPPDSRQLFWSTVVFYPSGSGVMATVSAEVSSSVFFWDSPCLALREEWESMHGAYCVISNSCSPMDCSPQGSSVLGFSRQEYWSGLSFPPPGDLPDPGIEPVASASPALAGGLFTTVPPGKPITLKHVIINKFLRRNLFSSV